MIKFAPSIAKEYVEQKETLFNEWYNNQAFDFKHKSLGMIPVAELTSDVDINYISKFDRIQSVCIV